MTPQDALVRVIEHREIFHDEMLALMRQIMNGEMSPTLISAIIIGLRVKKETIGEIAAAAQVMREFSTKVEVTDHAHLLDTCGTGGDATAGNKRGARSSLNRENCDGGGEWFNNVAAV